MEYSNPNHVTAKFEFDKLRFEIPHGLPLPHLMSSFRVWSLPLGPEFILILWFSFTRLAPTIAYSRTSLPVGNVSYLWPCYVLIELYVRATVQQQHPYLVVLPTYDVQCTCTVKQ